MIVYVFGSAMWAVRDAIRTLGFVVYAERFRKNQAELQHKRTSR